MTPPSYAYNNGGRFSEDDGQFHHSPGPSVSPPPPYHVVVAERLRRASASHSQGQSPPILTAFRTHQHGTPTQGHVTSVSPESAYAAVLASEMAAIEGLVYHHLVQVPYPGAGYPPGSPPVPPGFPPPRSPHQASAHLVPQPLPTHTGRDPGPVIPSSLQPNPPVLAHQQPISAPTSALTSTPTPTATVAPTSSTEPSWTPEQDRLLLRLHKDEHQSHSNISAALEDVFQVKRDASAVKKRLAQLRARSKVWSEDKLKQAAQKAMQSFSSVMQEEVASSFELHFTGDSNRDRDSMNDADNNKQAADLRLAVRLELEKMLAQGDGHLTRTMEKRMVSEQKERSERYRTALGQRDRVDGDGDVSGDQVEDYEIL